MNQKLAEARILAARKMPYMTHQVMSLIPVERPGMSTMAVDEYCRLYFDPAFLEGRELKHLAFVVLHEAIHVWGRHAKRCLRLLGEKPPPDRLALWRQAVDAAVADSVPEWIETVVLNPEERTMKTLASPFPGANTALLSRHKANRRTDSRASRVLHLSRKGHFPR